MKTKLKNFHCPIDIEEDYVIFCVKNKITQSSLFAYFMKHVKDIFANKTKEEIQKLIKE